jgi:LysR family pca operon transcriptional activator
MKTTFTRLQHLLMTARLRSVSRAAEALRISQPALSRSLTALEDAYGVKVFERDRTGVSITSAGERVIREAEAVVNAARTFDHNVTVLGGGEAGRLAVGISPVLASLILPALGSHLFNKRPRAELRTSIRSPRQLLDELLNDQIELLYCPGSEVEQMDDLHRTVLRAVTFEFVCRAGHPLAGKRAVSLEQVAEFPLATAAEFHIGGTVAPSSYFLCDNDEITKRVVANSNAIWLCCPDMLAISSEESGLYVLDVAGMGKMIAEITLVRRRRRTLSPIATEAINFVETLLSRYPDV